jgi:phosphatidylglycerophosphate synthase
MKPARPEVVIFAEAPEALTELCGVGLLERLLRILVRLGIEQTIVVSSTPEAIRAAIEPASRARQGLATRVLLPNEFAPAGTGRLLVLPGNCYLDARLLRALLEAERSAILIDSNPPPLVRPLLAGCRRDPQRGFDSGVALLVPNEFESWKSRSPQSSWEAIDAANVSSYIRGMRRHIRPVFFPAPSSDNRAAAERVIFDTGQNGTLDIPAILHAPAENFVLRGLCRTEITPNQITGFGFLLGTVAAVLFATGHLGWGMILALVFGVIDGLDGKQARIKIETTPSGKWEHHLDFVIETSWWATLAFCFQRSGQLSQAWWYFAVIVSAGIIDQLAKQSAQRRIPCLLDDFSPFDRFVRLIGARRNIYLWSLGVGLLFGVAARTYALCACWGVITAGVHAVRALVVAAREKSSSR